MSDESSHESLLRDVLAQVTEQNRQQRPGTPMAELRAAIKAALGSLPPLEFEEFDRALDDSDAADRLVRRAPELIGWNADQIVEWVEELSKKL